MDKENKITSYSYRNLNVWKRAQDLTLKIIRLTSRFPQSRPADVLARQIIRSASSIARIRALDKKMNDGGTVVKEAGVGYAAYVDYELEE